VLAVQLLQRIEVGLRVVDALVLTYVEKHWVVAPRAFSSLSSLVRTGLYSA
jgi:hypothetical protein